MIRAVLTTAALLLAAPVQAHHSGRYVTATVLRQLCTKSLMVVLGSMLTLQGPSIAQERKVISTVYHPDFHGRTTYCGQTYQHWGLSAAHPWLPCNTPVRVSHKGRTITVRVTDRCDCNSIDLSAGAAYRLGVPLDGIATVAISHP